MKKHELEWYIAKTNSYIYDEEVIELITPKLNDSINTLKSIIKFIEENTKNIDSLPLTDRYLEYEETLSVIQDVLDCYFSKK